MKKKVNQQTVTLEVRNLLKFHRTSKNAITAKQLAAQIAYATKKQVQIAIKELREKKYYIASGNSGYFFTSQKNVLLKTKHNARKYRKARNILPNDPPCLAWV